MATTLSIVSILKNDDHDHSLVYKLNTILGIYNSLFKNYTNKKIELLFVDWGSKKPVLDSLKITKFLSKQISYFHILPKDAKKINPKESFPVAQALNFGIRKSVGQYIMVTGVDQFLGPQQLSLLISILETPKYHHLDPLALFTMPRKFLNAKWHLWKEPPAHTIFYLNYLNQHKLPFYNDNVNYCSGEGALLTHKENIEVSLLLDESWNGYGWNDIQLFLRSTQKKEHHNLGNNGIFMYKFPRSLGSRKNLVNAGKLVKKYPKGYFNLGIPKKSKDWGIDSRYNRICKEKIIESTKSKPNNDRVKDSDETSFAISYDHSLLDIILNFICLKYSINKLIISEYFLRPKNSFLFEFINSFNDFSISLLRYSEKLGNLDWFDKFYHISDRLEKNGFFGKLRQIEISPDTCPSLLTTEIKSKQFSSLICFFTAKKYFFLPQLLKEENINCFIFFENKFQIKSVIPACFKKIQINNKFSLITHSSNYMIIKSFKEANKLCVE
jgi:hypothetical protein